MKTRYGLKGFHNGDIRTNKFERNNIFLLGTPAVCAFEYLVMSFSKRIPPREKHSHEIGERAVRGEVPRIGVCIPFIPSGYLILEDASNRRFIRAALRAEHRRAQHYHNNRSSFHNPSVDTCRQSGSAVHDGPRVEWPHQSTITAPTASHAIRFVRVVATGDVLRSNVCGCARITGKPDLQLADSGQMQVDGPSNVLPY